MRYLKTYEEIQGVTFREWLKVNHILYLANTLYCQDENLIDLDGIQEFKDIRVLNCYKNKLTNLNLEGLNKLEELYCYDNKLTSLNLEGCSNLRIIWCENNKLETLNLEGLEKLEHLNCENNKLPYGDLNEYWDWKKYPERWEAKKFNF